MRSVLSLSESPGIKSLALTENYLSSIREISSGLSSSTQLGKWLDGFSGLDSAKYQSAAISAVFEAVGRIEYYDNVFRSAESISSNSAASWQGFADDLLESIRSLPVDFESDSVQGESHDLDMGPQHDAILDELAGRIASAASLRSNESVDGPGEIVAALRSLVSISVEIRDLQKKGKLPRRIALYLILFVVVPIFANISSDIVTHKIISSHYLSDRSCESERPSDVVRKVRKEISAGYVMADDIRRIRVTRFQRSRIYSMPSNLGGSPVGYVGQGVLVEILDRRGKWRYIVWSSADGHGLVGGWILGKRLAKLR